MEAQIKFVWEALKKRLPGARWAAGVLVLIAVVAIALFWVKDPLYAVIGAVVVLALMMVLYVFSRFGKIQSKSMRLLATVAVYWVMLVFLSTLTLAAISLFFNQPWPIRDGIFRAKVEQAAEDAGLKYAAEMARGLSEPALLRLVQMGTSHQMVGSLDQEGSTYSLHPIPEGTQELDQKDLIDWSMPRSEFEKVAAKYGLRIPLPGMPPQQTGFADVSADDRKVLRDFSYELNKKGDSLYEIITGIVVKQITER